MITFNELRITPDGQYLIVDVQIESDSYFDDITLDSILIDTLDTYTPSGPSKLAKVIKVNRYNERPVFTQLTCNCNPIETKEDKKNCYTIPDESQKHFRRVFSLKELLINFSNKMLFVYVKAVGTPSPDTPCGYDNSLIMNTVINLLPLYKKAIQNISEVGKSCIIPKSFIDVYLLFKALQINIKTGNYLLAIDIWNKYFYKDNRIDPVKSRNCYGNNRNNARRY